MQHNAQIWKTGTVSEHVPMIFLNLILPSINFQSQNEGTLKYHTYMHVPSSCTICIEQIILKHFSTTI